MIIGKPKKILVSAFIVITIAFVYTKLDKTPSIESVSQDLLDWKSEELLFNYKGKTLSYHDSGGEFTKVVVLLHGYPTSSFDWHLIWPELKTHYRLIAMDMLGFGFSDKPNGIDYSIAMQTDILESLLKKLNIESINLIAHDYGDNVAQELLARNIEKKEEYPLRIESVTLLNGGLFPETHNPTIIQSLFSSPIGALAASFTNQTLFNKSFNKVFGPNSKPTAQDLINQWYIICHQKGYKIADKLTHASYDRKNNRERWVGAIINPQVPVLYMSGQLDPVTGMQTVDRYLELVPHPNVITLDEVGHYPQLENPTEVLKQIKTHITKVDSSSNIKHN
ncbi:alpha/beta hydrolase [uncultured Croceitalea sp.]|uniref:alpha/beta fold hydrolase n=1 Tax=uncultured Croceitalea sp. TaxID=1798908 RepID=UPI0033062DE9